MTHYEHLLLVVDLSEDTTQLIEEALFLKKKFNSTISLVHILELTPMAYQNDFSLPSEGTEYTQANETHAQNQLYNFAEQFNIPKDACHLIKETEKSTITELATSIAADLMIIGKRHHGGIKKLLGAFENAILNTAPCNVLIIQLKGNLLKTKE